MRASMTIVVGLVLAACGGKSSPDDGDADGVAAFETVRAVLQHPRCQNCHPAGDAPLQGEDSLVHSQNVKRGPEGRGMVGEECTTCHGQTNPPASYGEHVPPGVSEGWHMPPPDMKMVFVGRSARELCEQIKNPATNGGKDMAALRKHLDTPLVVWGWKPGFGRVPVPTPYDEFIAAWETWARAGAPCP
jgi:hypothetical protein